jgi:hypothetical protein
VREEETATAVADRVVKMKIKETHLMTVLRAIMSQMKHGVRTQSEMRRGAQQELGEAETEEGEEDLRAITVETIAHMRVMITLKMKDITHEEGAMIEQ